MTGGALLGPMQIALLLEACRMVDRLDRLDALINGERAEWLRLEPGADDDSPVVVVLDSAVSEARLTATALRGLLAEIRQAGRTGVRPGAGTGAAVPAKGEPANSDAVNGAAAEEVGSLGDLTARIAARRSHATTR